MSTQENDLNKVISYLKKDLKNYSDAYVSYFTQYEFVMKKNLEDSKTKINEHKLTTDEKKMLKKFLPYSHKLFFINEAVKSFEITTALSHSFTNFKDTNKMPISKSHFMYGMFNKKIKKINCIPLLYYSVNDKTASFFPFLFTYVKEVCNQDLKNKFNFCNNMIIKNVSLEEADSIGLYLRMIIYFETNLYNNKTFDKNLGLKTKNFVIHEGEDPNKSKYPVVIYSIADLGIKEPNIKSQEVQNLAKIYKNV